MYTGPNINKNVGLVLDASNSKSIISTDLSKWNSIGNITATFEKVGVPQLLNENGGIINYSEQYDRYLLSDFTFFDNPTSMSMFGWFRITGNVAGYRCVLHKGSAATVGSSVFWFGASSANLLVATIGADVVGWSQGQTNISADLNVWWNLGATWDGNTVRVYVNGIKNKEYALSVYNNVSNHTSIGSATSTATYHFLGDIGQISMWYDKVLSDEDILRNYNQMKIKFPN